MPPLKNTFKKQNYNPPVGFIPRTFRESKALKIVKILQDNDIPCDKTLSLLDIGTGNGEIAYYLSHYFKVTSLDIIDQRQIITGFRFIQLSHADSSLPFENEFFDIVIRKCQNL
jgi:SAM-dependent methyltransferase